MDPTEVFAEIVSRDMFAPHQAALAMAAHVYPDLDLAAQDARLAELADRVTDPTREALRRVLFGEVALRGNVDDYYDPDNSFLNRVLDRGLGIPISLALVMMAVGRPAGVPLVGINAPSHFLIRDETDGALLDPFNGGVEVPFVVAPVASHLQIIDRMLNNLRTIYTTRGELDNLLWVLRLRTLIPGAPAETGYEFQRAQAKLN